MSDMDIMKFQCVAISRAGFRDVSVAVVKFQAMSFICMKILSKLDICTVSSTYYSTLQRSLSLGVNKRGQLGRPLGEQNLQEELVLICLAAAGPMTLYVGLVQNTMGE